MRAVVLLSLLVVVTACGGKSSSSVGSVTKNDLAIMVLPATVLGEIATGLDVDTASGFQDATEVAADTIDPSDTAEDIEDLGLEANYQLSYTSPGGSTDPVQVSTQVALFGSAEQATNFVATTVGDAEGHEGAMVEDAGVTLESIEVSEADGPGDSAWEGTAKATAGTSEISSTIVAFTVDTIGASVSATKLGEPVPIEDVRALAEKLASRIEAVAAGDVSDTPVAVPTETTSTTAAEDPALERMVLALADLPAGVSIENDGFATGGGDVAFEREFALGNSTIGRSKLLGLQSNVERLGSAAEAALAVQAVSGIVQGPQGKQLFSEAFAQGAGFDAESLEIEELSGKGIGDAATVLHATFDTRAGPFEAIFVFMAEGSAAGQLYAAGAKGQVFPEDILGLARTVAQKMEAEQ